ncbi:MAG: hypothetical protein H7124_15290 [Phycisphaerales bacterium]|nr:hypothetical protein [Hyphomonadaceae bacterium]
MNLIQPHTTKKQCQAFYAQALLWLVRLLALVMRWAKLRESRTLKRIVQRRERFIGHVLFLTAVTRLRPRQYVKRKPAHGRGFRRTHGHIHLLIKSARIGLRGANMRERALHLLEVLANPEPYIAHFMKRLRKGLKLCGLILCAPAAIALPRAPAFPIAAADSS